MYKLACCVDRDAWEDVQTDHTITVCLHSSALGITGAYPIAKCTVSQCNIVHTCGEVSGSLSMSPRRGLKKTYVICCAPCLFTFLYCCYA